MTRHVYFLIYLAVISVTSYIPGVCTEEVLKAEKQETELIDDAMFQEGTCNVTNPCQNGGFCLKGVCRCLRDYTGARCETPKWCAGAKCGYQENVECVWNQTQQKGYCQCNTPNHYFMPKDRMCYECTCGVYGSCVVVDDVMVCVCEKGYAVESGKCIDCNCGPQAERCSYNTKGDKVCQCKEGFASLPGRLRLFGAYCEECDCGEHGKCRFAYNDDKQCDCEDGFRPFKGKCVDCDCGMYGTCELDKNGAKICTCDYGFAEKSGICEHCDCSYYSTRRDPRINCTFDLDTKRCDCPTGYKLTTSFDPECEDINECYTFNPCPDGTNCINKIGSYECECKKGFEPKYYSHDVKRNGCQDIDECAYSPCESPATKCVNSIGSYDCICKDGFYATAATGGYTYKPSYNNCHEKETQWKSASIALGVILSVGILWVSFYIYRHKRR